MSRPTALPSTTSTHHGIPVQLESVDFAHRGTASVFKGLELTLASSEFVAVVGPSGCGKSTLLDLVAGFLSPRSGRVVLDGSPAAPESPLLAYVFQAPNLFPWLDVHENVRFGLRMAGRLPESDQHAAVDDLLATVHLTHAARLLPHQLSGGMRQRAALARALILSPRLLLADEPFGALDAITRRQMNEELLRLWTQKRPTVVFVTHDVDEALLLSDRVLVLGRSPAGIVLDLEIGLPRPRTHETTPRLPGYAGLRDRIVDAIEGGAPARVAPKRVRLDVPAPNLHPVP